MLKLILFELHITVTQIFCMCITARVHKYIDIHIFSILFQVSGSRSRHNSGQTQWQRTESGNYRKPKPTQYKSNAASSKNSQDKTADGTTNKAQSGKANHITSNKVATSQSQCKPTDKKYHTKDKENVSKTENAKTSTHNSKMNNSLSKHESIGKGHSESVKQTVPATFKTIPKTAPVPVPQSPTASSR